MNMDDTITAIATPPGEGGIGIIRISGNDSIAIIQKIFIPKKPVKEFLSHHLYYGAITNPSNNSPIDDCLMTIMKSPHSYTGEDVVEIHCHGGSLILKQALEAVIKSGARLAEPGEFTKRAFLNNRMDLLQAESVIELIRAKTDLSLNIARNHVSGRLSERLNSIKEGLINILCYIEAELDFPDEEDVQRLSDSKILEIIDSSKIKINELISTYEEGRLISEGLKAIIIGRVNAGKSSLLNCLLKEERAIVTPIPGTTRDVIEEVVNIKGVPVRLMDTAGLRDTEDKIEELGIRFTMDRLKKADLALFIADVSNNGISDDLNLFERVYEACPRMFQAGNGKRFLIVFNKMDIADERLISLYEKAFSGHHIVKISALLENGIDELKEAVFTASLGHGADRLQEVIITNLRHKTALENAEKYLGQTRIAAEENLSKEFLASELKGAVDAIGEITGSVTSDEILDRIFSQFCIGK